MAEKTVYILHKNGANSHYIALKYLLNKEGIGLKYREFSVLSKFFKSIVKFDLGLFKKQCINLAFLIDLLFSKHKKVVLGIAPFDSKLLRLSRVLKHHRIYYHTSWTCWDGTFQPKSAKSENIKMIWKAFLEKTCEHIFCVSHKSKNELLKNYRLEAQKISVVNHAVDAVFFQNTTSVEKEKHSFIYVGRLVPQKGIEELLDYFSANTSAKLSLLGSGSEESKAKAFSEQYDNINYYPYTSDKAKIAKLISRHQYFVLNSKKTNKWEELFGLALIESMARGVIPIASNHSGPNEIVGESDGYIFKEGEIAETLDDIISKNEPTQALSKSVAEKAKLFKVENIADLWKPILN